MDSLYSKIEGQGNQGQFVHDGQDMAKKEGFGHVSKLWYDKTCLLYTSDAADE